MASPETPACIDNIFVKRGPDIGLAVNMTPETSDFDHLLHHNGNAAPPYAEIRPAGR